MRFTVAVLTLGLISSCWGMSAGQVAQETSTAPPPPVISGSLDSVRIKGFISPSRSELGSSVIVDILLQNTHATATISPVTINLPQFTLNPDEQTHLKGLSIPPRSRLSRTVTIVPVRSGPFDVLIELATPVDAVREPIARLDVVDPPSFLAAWAPVIIPLVVAGVAALATIWIQLRVLTATNRQRASESVIQIVTNQGRDYYFAVSGALKELTRALERLSSETVPGEREHLMRRAFFFYGIFLYKENEFAFSHGYLYLGNLWAEAAIRRILNEISTLIPLVQSDESVVHKCFSDMWRLHRGEAVEQDTVIFKIRTLYDLEAVLSNGTRKSEQELQRVFALVRAHFTDQAKVARLRALTRAFGLVLEYEFTKLFQDWYAGAKGERQIPKTPPPDFDKISGLNDAWPEVLKTLGEL